MTVHEEAAELLLTEMLHDDQDAIALDRTVRDLQQRKHDPRYVSAIGQTRHDAGSWPLSQMAAYLGVHAGITSGQYAMFNVPIEAEPGPDADREGNAAKLATLGRPFHAELDMVQNAGDQDGQLAWAESVRSTRSTGLPAISGCDSVPVVIPYRIHPATAPLEVGTSLPSRTWTHLRVEGMVARWPYGSRQLTVIIDTDRNWAGRSVATEGIGL